LRRARKDWVKGNRDRAVRYDPEAESVVVGQEKMRPRAIAIDESGAVETLPRGQVVVVESGRYDVVIDATGELFSCRIKRGASSENDSSTLVVVGDFVRLQPLEGERGLIHHVEQRRTRLGRESAGREVKMEQVIAANVDLLLCLIASDRPDFRRTIIDRYVVASLLGGVEPVIVVNKIDAVEGELRELIEEEMEIYARLGYHLVFTSAVRGDGMDELQRIIAGKTSVLIGQSGVGKSSLANALMGTQHRRTAEVRERDRRGTHTTVDSSMMPLPEGGYLVDTPGLREFGIWDLEQGELDGYFVEFLEFNQHCRYLPCTHTHEPGCAIIDAVGTGAIDEGRYASYMAIFETLKKRSNASGRR